MIFGHLTVDAEHNILRTHRGFYALHVTTAAWVDRPFRATGCVFGFGFIGFGIVFGDLLHAGEIALITLGAIISFVLGWQAGQLKLLSHDLRSSEMSGVVWGSHVALYREQLKIEAVVSKLRGARA